MTDKDELPDLHELIEELGSLKGKALHPLESISLPLPERVKRQRNYRRKTRLLRVLEGEEIQIAKPKTKKPPRPYVAWWSCPRVKNRGYWRKKIKGKMYYFKFPNTPEGYEAAVLEAKKIV